MVLEIGLNISVGIIGHTLVTVFYQKDMKIQKKKSIYSLADLWHLATLEWYKILYDHL